MMHEEKGRIFGRMMMLEDKGKGCQRMRQEDDEAVKLKKNKKFT